MADSRKVKNKEKIESSLREFSEKELSKVVQDAAEEYGELIRANKLAKAQAAKALAKDSSKLAKVIIDIATNEDGKASDRLRAAGLGLQILGEDEELKLSLSSASGLTINITQQQASKIEAMASL
jgi:hypothetical protein